MLTASRAKSYLREVHLYLVRSWKHILPCKASLIDISLGWEPIFEHNGETLAEMEHDKKVRDIY